MMSKFAMRRELSAAFTLMCIKNHTHKKEIVGGRVNISLWSFQKMSPPHCIGGGGLVTGLVRAPVGWKIISHETLTYTHRTKNSRGKKQPIKEDNTHCPQRHQFVWMRSKWTAGLCDVDRAWFYSPLQKTKLRGPGAAIRSPAGWGLSGVKYIVKLSLFPLEPWRYSGGLLYARKYYLAVPSILIRKTGQELQPQQQGPPFC